MKNKQPKTGDLVQVSECNTNGVTYGIISIRLQQQYPQLQQAQTVLAEFMRQLQPTFAVQHTTGPQVAQEPFRVTLTDYWQDVEGLDWKVKGCTDGKTMAVLYIKNIAQVAVTQETFFLNGALFTLA